VKQTRLFLGVVIGASFLAACGPADVGGVVDSTAPIPQTTVSEPTPETSATTETTGETPTTIQAPDAPASDRMVAPDFTLALGSGGAFTLSESEKPVYLVFWAEW